jgi:hypothetical protein
METDVRMRNAAQAMIDAIPVPNVPLPAIRDRIARLRRLPSIAPLPKSRRFAATAAVALVLLPAMAYAVVSYETRSRAELQARGGWAPPGPPVSFASKLQPRSVTLAKARAAAGFALVEPAGLPEHTSLLGIEMGPVGLYERSTNEWKTGPSEVIFRYRRVSGRRFEIVAQRYDPKALPGRYIFEDRGPDASGNPLLVKRETIGWRNGEQMSIANESNALDRNEILSIARAMNGTLLILPLHSPHSNGSLRMLSNPH